MKSFIKKFFDKSLVLFLIIGACNTVLSLALQFALFNWAHFGIGVPRPQPLPCAASAAFISIKVFFSDTEKSVDHALLLALVIAVCYVLAYYVAQPLTGWLLRSWLELEARISDQIAMLVGQVIFTLLNYTGQKFLCFKSPKIKRRITAEPLILLFLME